MQIEIQLVDTLETLVFIGLQAFDQHLNRALLINLATSEFLIAR